MTTENVGASGKRGLGRAGETVARDWLIKNGYSIVRMNYTVKGGEIDIIAEDEKYIVFTEVKTRTKGHSVEKYGRPASAVDPEKSRHVIHAAKEYLRTGTQVCAKKPRIDVIEVELEYFDGFVAAQIRHYKNAVIDRREEV